MNGLNQFNPTYFRCEVHDDVAVADFTAARITEEDNVELLGQDLFALVEKMNFRKVIVGLQAVEYVTSSVVGKLITLHRKLVRNEGVLIIYGIHGTLHDILDASQLTRYFNTVDDRNDAFNAVG
ncbi:MAG: STAS domain-containing protein [Maioricimonas sp. JB049]